MSHSVLLDTSFFIRLLNSEDPLHGNAKEYYKYFLNNDIIMKVSTVSIAEYCVKGAINDLPLRNLQIIPFNVDHAEKAGEFANIVFTVNKNSVEKLTPRTIIPNDTKLFAQADTDPSITQFVTSDKECTKVYDAIKVNVPVKFEIINIHIPYNETFGLLGI